MTYAYRSALAVLFLCGTTLVAGVSAHATDFSSTVHTHASFSAARTLLLASSSPGNAYASGISVVVASPIAGDFSVLGGEVISAAPVGGDALLLAGSVAIRALVGGDVRIIGGNISIERPIAGDLVAAGLSVRDAAPVGGNVFITALNVTLSGGASGPVMVYGNTVALAGTFASDVTIIASGHISLAPGTVIRGALSYQAPEVADVPPSVVISGGTLYHPVSYLPNVGTSRVLAFASAGLFILVRILGALILAGLLTGLFPALSYAVVARTRRGRVRQTLLTALLGFSFIAATPVLLVVLALTFVGMGIALLGALLYALILLLSLVYAGILLGGLLARWYTGRDVVLWHDGMLGMLILSIISLIPIVGLPIVFLLAAFVVGTLLLIFFDSAFSGGMRSFTDS